MRLDKYLADMSIGTRSQVKDIIKDKRITINDEIVKKADYQVKESDTVKLDGQIIEYVNYEYYILNKPSGFICATEDNHQRTIMELIKSKRKDLVPVGRLDKDTEGIILITNDGELNHRLLSSKYHIKKKYYVETDIDIKEDAKEIFSKPIQFDEFVSLPAEFERITKNSAYLTIIEGKYHQVKRMFKHIGCTVTYLKRVEFGTLTLKDLNVGEYRELSKNEIMILKAI